MEGMRPAKSMAAVRSRRLNIRLISLNGKAADRAAGTDDLLKHCDVLGIRHVVAQTQYGGSAGPS